MIEQKNKFSGAVGALLDLYRNALNELVISISDLDNLSLTEIIDKETEDEDCRSIQSILSHVVQSAKTYIVEIRKSLGDKNANYSDLVVLNSVEEYENALKIVLYQTEEIFIDYPNPKMVELRIENKFTTRWGQIFDIEQLMQHAIVHVLCHKRQIENFKRKSNDFT